MTHFMSKLQQTIADVSFYWLNNGCKSAKIDVKVVKQSISPGLVDWLIHPRSEEGRGNIQYVVD